MFSAVITYWKPTAAGVFYLFVEGKIFWQFDSCMIGVRVMLIAPIKRLHLEQQLKSSSDFMWFISCSWHVSSTQAKWYIKRSCDRNNYPKSPHFSQECSVFWFCFLSFPKEGHFSRAVFCILITTETTLWHKNS